MEREAIPPGLGIELVITSLHGEDRIVAHGSRTIIVGEIAIRPRDAHLRFRGRSIGLDELLALSSGPVHPESMLAWISRVGPGHTSQRMMITTMARSSMPMARSSRVPRPVCGVDLVVGLSSALVGTCP